MKKNFFLWVAVFAVGAMSSCSVDKVVDQAEARYIGFDPFANKVTRGLNADDFGHSNFSVFGRYKEETSKYNVIFNNKEVKWTGSTPDDVSGSWEYESLVPWVSGKYYQFAAIAPYKASGYSYNYGADINVPGTYTLGEITVDATEANQIDYMTAAPKDNVQSGASPVSFDFNHILSKIDFIFKPKTDNTDGKNTHWQSPVRIEITKIELTDVPTTNTYATDAWGELGKTSDGTNKTITTDFTDDNPSVTTSYDGSSTTKPTAKTFDWLVVPQGTTSGEITKTLTITCNVYDNATSDGTLLKGNATASVDIKTSWAKNTYYTYTVSIGADILGANPYITFDVKEVTDWTPDTSNSVDVTPTQP